MGMVRSLRVCLRDEGLCKSRFLTRWFLKGVGSDGVEGAVCDVLLEVDRYRVAGGVGRCEVGVPAESMYGERVSRWSSGRGTSAAYEKMFITGGRAKMGTKPRLMMLAGKKTRTWRGEERQICFGGVKRQGKRACFCHVGINLSSNRS